MLSFLMNQTLVLALSFSLLFPSAQQIDGAIGSAVNFLKQLASGCSAGLRNAAVQDETCHCVHKGQKSLCGQRHDRYFVTGKRRSMQMRSYKNLPPGKSLSDRPGAVYHMFKTVYGSRVHLIVVDMDALSWDLRPGVNATVDTTTHSGQSRSAAATINGGYFGLSDGASVSYVVVDGKEEASPRRNPSLQANTRLSSSVKDAIYNRSEFRVLVSTEGKNHVVVAHHDEPIPSGYKLLHSLQAGPRLLPELNVEKEAFVRLENGKMVDVIRSRQMVARTAFGVTADRRVLLVCVEGGEEQQGKGGATLVQVQQLMLDLGCVEALNLDGGSSTTMYVSYPDADGKITGRTVCRNNPERRVKSVLLLFAKKQVMPARSSSARSAASGGGDKR